MKAVQTRLSLKDAAVELAGTDGTPQWDFEDDEYVLLRNPFTCPMKYIWDDARKGAELAGLPDDDPQKQEFVRVRNHRTLMWSFVDWRIYDDEGELIPKVSPLNDDGWFALSPGQQFFLEILVMKHYYSDVVKDEGETKAELPITLDDDEDPLSDRA